ncbi:MAG: hypothetical protein QW842_07350 [Candidatus Nezhaarchaeales archaeon]
MVSPVRVCREGKIPIVLLEASAAVLRVAGTLPETEAARAGAIGIP